MRSRDNNTYMFKSAAYSTDMKFRISKEEKEKLNYDWLPRMKNNFNNLETKVLKGSYSILEGASSTYFEKLFRMNQRKEDLLPKVNTSLPSLLPSSFAQRQSEQLGSGGAIKLKKIHSPDISQNLTTNATITEETEIKPNMI